MSVTVDVRTNIAWSILQNAIHATHSLQKILKLVFITRVCVVKGAKKLQLLCLRDMKSSEYLQNTMLNIRVHVRFHSGSITDKFKASKK